MLELEIIKFLHNIVVHYIQVLNDYDNHWNYSVTMDTGSNISKISKYAPKLMKLNMIVDCQVWMRLLTLEFQKWPPLPWKLQKCQIFSKCSKLNET